ncbi:gamma-glutamyltransferase [Chitinimonas taiwanensis]|uniref:Glutathione hydrolase proenzyme n=1 Tax=Chitinimonas taiwanensis DSM 18899 TaxID=1121279 RepID=A0A1K2HRR7_9NEIS|nr:gamma-glutamyltransferase [Chitinimonas taiwanensis]SFZ79438.1 gamma-glutamyltransferase 2. Threonine peptidase. MEROPS family T03 [Chitinimonas taiwanensis DSM 18899]
MPSRIALSLALCLAAISSQAADRITDQPFATRSEVIAPKAMAATSQPLATQIALDILRQGGTAVDAAIAANAALGLMEPVGSGIGGDLFALVWDAKTQQLYGLNASGRSPRSLSLATLKAELAKQQLNEIPPFGPLPVSVPGAVDGWFELHQRFGKLTMGKILAPSIAYARDGFPVSEVISFYWQRNVRSLLKYPGIREQFTRDGVGPAKGQLWTNPNLARTYEALAKGGRDVFYRGEIARKIAAYMARHGGYLSYEDLAAHKSEWVSPLKVNYRGYDVWELPPNSQGMAALQALNILEGFDLKGAGFGSPQHVHWFVEATKLAFADRAKFYADPDFFQAPITTLLSDEYAAERRKLIGTERALQKVEAGNIALKTSDTIYLTTADAQGNMVSLIQSNYRGMGSGMAPEDLGFILQDRGQLFALEDGHANVYAPGKRPFQTIIPAFISKDGKPWVSFGVMGGDMQPQGHVQIVLNLIDFGMNLQEAGDAPRIYWDSPQQPTGGTLLDGGTVALETGFPYRTIQQLLQMRHTVKYDLGGYGGYQAIMRLPNGTWAGASESRKDGQAAGF